MASWAQVAKIPVPKPTRSCVKARTPGAVEGVRRGMSRAVPMRTIGTPLYAVHLKLPDQRINHATNGLKVEEASEKELRI